VTTKPHLDQRIAYAIIKAHRASGSGLAYPMSLTEMTAAVRVMLRQFTLTTTEDLTNERHKVVKQGS
jgi:hypothetical protein